jgi:hypothetical protein
MHIHIRIRMRIRNTAYVTVTFLPVRQRESTYGEAEKKEKAAVTERTLWKLRKWEFLDGSVIVYMYDNGALCKQQSMQYGVCINQPHLKIENAKNTCQSLLFISLSWKIEILQMTILNSRYPDFITSAARYSSTRKHEKSIYI